MSVDFQGAASSLLAEWCSQFERSVFLQFSMRKLLLFVLFAVSPISAYCAEKDVHLVEAAVNDCASFVSAANHARLEGAWHEVSRWESNAVQERLYAHRVLPLTLVATIAGLDDKTILEKGWDVEPVTAADCRLSLVDPKNPPTRYRVKGLDLDEIWTGKKIQVGQFEEAAKSWLSKRAAALTRIGPKNDAAAAFADCEKSNPEFILIDLKVEGETSGPLVWNVAVHTLMPWDVGKYCVG